MSNSPRLGFTELTAGQAVPETTVNEAFRFVEQGAGAFVVKSSVSTPPGSPTDGDAHIVGAAATGAWTGMEERIAFYMNTAWEFSPAPVEGWRAYNQATNSYFIFDGSDWVLDYAVGGGGGLWIHIETLSPSAAASIASEGFAGLGYKQLKFVVDLIVSTDQTQLTANYKLNGSYQTGSNHRSAGTLYSSAGAANNPVGADTASLVLSSSGATWGLSNHASQSGYQAEIIINAPDSTRPKQCMASVGYMNVGLAATHGSIGGTYIGTDFEDPLQGFRIQPGGGTITGTIEVYGLTT